MKNIKQIGAAALVVALLGGLSACDSMTTRQRDTAVGAGVGGAAGSPCSAAGALSTCSAAPPWAWVIGNQVREITFCCCAAGRALAPDPQPLKYIETSEFSFRRPRFTQATDDALSSFRLPVRCIARTQQQPRQLQERSSIMNPKLTLTALASVAVLSGCYYVPYGYGYPGYPGYPAYPAVGTCPIHSRKFRSAPKAYIVFPRRPPATNTPSRNRLSPYSSYPAYPAYPYFTRLLSLCAYPYAGYPYYTGYGYGYPSISVGFRLLGRWWLLLGRARRMAWRRMARWRQWLARRWRTQPLKNGFIRDRFLP